MRTITLIRQQTNGKAVTGTLTFELNGKQYSFPSLENADYLIPEGTYPVERTWSPRFKKLLPLIQNVPDREGIRIHRGSIPEHSHGCILTDMGGMSYLQVLFNIIEQKNEYNDEPESAIIAISQA
jgi:hypothetical protein